MSTPSATEAERLLERYDLSAIDAFEDAREDRLRYSLLRLTLAGLGREDVKSLAEIGELVFAGSDASGAVEGVRARRGAAPLARVIATVVERGADRPVDPRHTLLGALSGAHVGLLAGTEAERAGLAIIGAMAGAAAAACVPLALESAERVGAAAYTRQEG
jgi:hypothetical protein